MRDAAATLDLNKPTAVILFGILHFFDDIEDPNRIVTHLTDALPSSSYLAISHLAKTDELTETFDNLNKQMRESVVLRTQPEVVRFFDGLDLIDPGVVELPQWRPDPETDEAGPLPMWIGVARKT